ncbi:MAG: serine hydrolase, partial [Acidaminococcaceae bacterium]|nr:serine hydrolase [Acidaminococcaceae bacterium]
MNTSINKHLGTSLTFLLVTLSAVPALAAPSAPVVRTPGKHSVVVVSSQPTIAKPAVREAIPTSAPKQEPKTQTSSPASAPKQNTIPAVSNNPAPVADKTAPAPKEAKPAAAKEKPSAEQKKARQQAADAVVPGHPFRIQNKEENYKSQLSKAATKKLDATLANMIGGAEDKVPGLAVIVFKDGKEVYRNMMGNRFLSPRNPNWNLPLTADSRFRVASISKIFTAAGYLK